MRPKQISIAPDAADPNGIYTTAVVAGAGALTLDGALLNSDGAAVMDYARRIGILSSGTDTGITFTIVGTDADGKAVTEVVTGADADTAESDAYFLTVSSITASGAAAANVTIGTVDEFVTNTIPVNHYASDPPTVAVAAISGTIDVTVEETYSEMEGDDTFVFLPGPASLTSITSDASGDMDNHITGIRLVCNSYTTGATLTMIINQNR